MGLIDSIAGRPTYLDSNIFIYLFEYLDQYGNVLRNLARAVTDGRVDAATSELSLAEVLVRPIREAPSFIPIYKEYLRSRSHFEVVAVARAVLIEAARLRSQTTLKLPDAIHAATALRCGCEVFLTNDTRIKSIPGIEVLYLEDFTSG